MRLKIGIDKYYRLTNGEYDYVQGKYPVEHLIQYYEGFINKMYIFKR
jgi:hypothetical protein